MSQLNQSALQKAKPLPNKRCNNSRSHLNPEIDAVLFDLFDTLVLIGDEHDSYIESLLEAHNYLSNNGLDCSFNDFKAAYFKVVNKIESETAFSLEEPYFGVYLERTVAELGLKLKEKEYLVSEAVNEFSKEFKTHITVDPQAFEVLALAHKKYKTGVISNLSFSECAWELLEEFGLKQFLDVIIVSGDVNFRKPHPQIFNMALSYLGVHASKVLFVGDTLETDVIGSKNAGMTSVHIKRKTVNATNIEPHLTITKLHQLLPVLDISLEELTAKSTTIESGAVDVTCQV
jgi:putative hydrolase of the HAD superfamily